MSRPFWFIAGYLLAILTATVLSAHAHLPAKLSKSDTPRQREHKLHVDIRHLAFVAEYGHGRPRREHRRALRWARRELADLHQRLLYVPPMIRAAFLCIHHYEGAWADPGAPYYGGLQMDLDFQRAYGAELLAAKGTADHWTPAEQIHVAYVAAFKRGRGFYPWPNTARNCGLL